MDKKYIISILVVIILIITLLLGSLSYFGISRKLNSNLSLVPNLQQNTEAKPDFSSLYNSGNFTELNKQLDDALTSNPSDVALLLQKAQALAQEASLTFKEKELGDQAMVYVDKALALDPKSVQALLLKGYLYEIQQNYTNAHKYYDMALKLDPNNADVLAQKGHAYWLEGKTLEAENFLNLSLSQDSNNLKALLHLANIHLGKMDDDRAYEILTKALALTTNARDRSDIYYSIGLIFESKGKAIDAIKHFQKSIETDPNYSLPYVALARSEFNSDKVEQSFSTLKKALELNPNQSMAALQLALQFDALGDSKSSSVILKKLPDMISRDITLTADKKQEVIAFVKAIINTQK